ncbi:MAG: hypothetical protein AABW80_03555 [Nanoarchaeota archaeon]
MENRPFILEPKKVELKPCVIFSSGIMAVGKTSVMTALAKRISNAFYLDRDDINQGNSYVSPTHTDELPDFEKYVAHAGIYPDHMHKVVTPFGQMWKVDPHNAFYRRHLRDQSYFVQMHLARTNLEAGKVPIIDCITTRQIQDGTLKKIIDSGFFSSHPSYLIHFACDEDECYDRAVARSKADEAARKRVDLIRGNGRTASPTSSRESFHRFMTEEQPMIPKELRTHPHLLINTSGKKVSQCVDECLNHLGYQVRKTE